MGRIIHSQTEKIRGIGMLDKQKLEELDKLMDEAWKEIDLSVPSTSVYDWQIKKVVNLRLNGNVTYTCASLYEALIDRKLDLYTVKSLNFHLTKGSREVNVEILNEYFITEDSSLEISTKPLEDELAIKIFNRLSTWAEQLELSMVLYVLMMVATGGAFLTLTAFYAVVKVGIEEFNTGHNALRARIFLIFLFAVISIFCYLISVSQTRLSGFEIGRGKKTVPRYKRVNRFIFKIIPSGIATFLLGLLVWEPLKSSVGDGFHSTLKGE